uniref:Large ribosomal subunit protein uL2m n=1 Tax=Timspurckia oligopyrenoides TaxID=708627 RepID=A0A7S0ZJ20_9RHOD
MALRRVPWVRLESVVRFRSLFSTRRRGFVAAANDGENGNEGKSGSDQTSAENSADNAVSQFVGRYDKSSAGPSVFSADVESSLSSVLEERKATLQKIVDPTCPPIEKKRKPTSPGQRHIRLIDKSCLYQGEPMPHLTSRLPRTGGRNNSGRITSWHRGGGIKRYYRQIDFNRKMYPDRPGTVERIEYDPNRSGLIALIRYDDMPEWEDEFLKYTLKFVTELPETNEAPRNPCWSKIVPEKIPTEAEIREYQEKENALLALTGQRRKDKLMERHFYYKWHKGKRLLVRQQLARAPYLTEEERYRYILCPQKLKIGQRIISSRTGPVDLVPGNTMPLRYVPIGTVIHNVEFLPGAGGKMCRAAGTSASLLEKKLDQDLALLRMQSKEIRYVRLNCLATIGKVSNPEHRNQVYGKAGVRRLMGWRPHVRGVAMNPIDHPHGGGEGATKGGRPSVTPWGKPCKAGYRTRDKKKDKHPKCMIVKRRPTRLTAHLK